MNGSTGLAWALLGASDIGATRTLPAIRRRGGRPLTVFSHDAAHGATFAAQNAIPHSTTNLDDALDDVDAVYISSKNEHHAEQALRAIAAGKHVLCEKPLALSEHDARRMVEAAEMHGVLLAVNHHLPGSPLHVAARSLIDDGVVGDVLSVRIRHAVMLPERLRGWRVALPAEQGGGVLFDVAIHDVSALNALIGRAKKVAATVSVNAAWAERGAEDNAMMLLEYESRQGLPVLAQTHDAYVVKDDPTTIEVQGTKGLIVITDAMTQDTAGTLALTTDGTRRVIDVDVSEDLYDIIIDRFTAAVRGQGYPTVTGREGLDALTVILAAHKSARTGMFVEID